MSTRGSSGLAGWEDGTGGGPNGPPGHWPEPRPARRAPVSSATVLEVRRLPKPGSHTEASLKVRLWTDVISAEARKGPLPKFQAFGFVLVSFGFESLKQGFSMWPWFFLDLNSVDQAGLELRDPPVSASAWDSRSVPPKFQCLYHLYQNWPKSIFLYHS